MDLRFLNTFRKRLHELSFLAQSANFQTTEKHSNAFDYPYLQPGELPASMRPILSPETKQGIWDGIKLTGGSVAVSGGIGAGLNYVEKNLPAIESAGNTVINKIRSVAGSSKIAGLLKGLGGAIESV